jgi:cation transport ATPase
MTIEPRPAGELPAAPSLDDVINIHLRPTGADDVMRAEVESVALAPAHAALIGDLDSMDRLLDRAIGPETFARPRIRLACDHLARLILSAGVSGAPQVMNLLPSFPPEAPEQMHQAVEAAGKLLVGLSTGLPDLTRAAWEALADNAVGREVVLVLSMFLANIWREQETVRATARLQYSDAVMPPVSPAITLPAAQD